MSYHNIGETVENFQFHILFAMIFHNTTLLNYSDHQTQALLTFSLHCCKESENINREMPNLHVYLGPCVGHQFLLAEHAYVQSEVNVLTCWICLISLIA